MQQNVTLIVDAPVPEVNVTKTVSRSFNVKKISLFYLIVQTKICLLRLYC